MKATGRTTRMIIDVLAYHEQNPQTPILVVTYTTHITSNICGVSDMIKLEGESIYKRLAKIHNHTIMDAGFCSALRGKKLHVFLDHDVVENWHNIPDDRRNILAQTATNWKELWMEINTQNV